MFAQQTLKEVCGGVGGRPFIYGGEEKKAADRWCCWRFPSPSFVQLGSSSEKVRHLFEIKTWFFFSFCCQQSPPLLIDKKPLLLVVLKSFPSSKTSFVLSLHWLHKLSSPALAVSDGPRLEEIRESAKLYVSALPFPSCLPWDETRVHAANAIYISLLDIAFLLHSKYYRICKVLPS